MKTDTPAVRFAINGELATITLNRPDTLNAMNLAWVNDFATAVDAIAAASTVSTVIVKGAGRAFCSGIDIKMLAAEGMPDGFYETQERAFRALETMDKISIAVLHGQCICGGLQLAISCDIRICHAQTQISMPAVGEGLLPGLSAYRLPRLIGLGHARRLILSGQTISPPEALQMGLVDHVIDENNFEPEVERLIKHYASLPRTAVNATRQALGNAFDATFDEAFETSKKLMTNCLAALDTPRHS